MKIFELSNSREKLLDAIYISLKANDDLRLLKYHYESDAIRINKNYEYLDAN